MFKFWNRALSSSDDLLTSRLFDQNTFYEALLKDLHNCRNELIIESPFVTAKRMSLLLPLIKELRERDVQIVVNTREPLKHEGIYRLQAEEAINSLLSLGVKVLYTGGHHRKLVILDRQVLWEGSLNILSFSDSCEIMRRIHSATLAEQMIKFLSIDEYLRKS
jgi:phosphatidylserine/phosphatidylglycerophosphate/cardiolipin synthase-like enzyme